MRTLLAKSVLLLSAIVFVAGCSSSDSGSKGTSPFGKGGKTGGNGKTGDNRDKTTTAPGPVGDQQNPHGTTLNMTAWCVNVSEEGSNYQLRVKLETSGTANQSVYTLDWKGARDEKVAEMNGTWSRRGNQLTTTFDGQTETAPMVLEEPSPVTGAPRLKVGNPGQETVFDPCE